MKFNLLIFSLLFGLSVPSYGKSKYCNEDVQHENPAATQTCQADQFVSEDGATCFTGQCPEGTHVALSDAERLKVLRNYNINISVSLEEADDALRRENFEVAIDICINEPDLLQGH
ncbi:hypothetical protein N9O57_01520 [bacterium]|nr:hypothetical protein [bacterium]